MNPQQLDQGLSELVDTYAQHLRELVDLLEIEHDALEKRDFDGIEQCTREKEQLLLKLEQLDRQRLEIQQQAGPQAAKACHKRFNQQLSSLLKKCSEINIVNGSIAGISKQFNQRMLDILLGVQVDDDKLYDARGSNTGNKLKQVFAKI